MTQLPMTDERMIELARELPVASPDAERVEAVRTSLLSSVEDHEPAPRRSWMYASGALAAAAAVLLVIGVQRGGDPLSVAVQGPIADDTTTRRAAVEASQAAHFTHTRSHGDEIVQLARGGLTVRVADLRAGERFRVVSGKAEVEAQSAAFEIKAGDDGLQSVHVRSGQVVIRVAGHKAVFLGAGQTWRPRVASVRENVGSMKLPDPDSAPQPQPDSVEPPPTPAADRVDRPTRATPRATTDTPRTETKPKTDEVAPVPPATTKPAAVVSPAESAFKRAWTAMRAKRYRDAAAGFGRVIALTPTGSFAPDARYWRGLALMRAGDTGAGRAALESFLVNHASSPRVGEVSAMLGWLHLKAGRKQLARQYFKAAVDDPRDDVRTSARAGLKAAR